jgi:diguanylate cyclase (GGDEF)-like protein
MTKNEQKLTENLLEAPGSQQKANRFLWAVHGFWLALILSLTSWHIWQDLAEIDRLVNREANIRLQTANHVRKWIVSFGGVYAPVSDVHQPNPYIPESANRDVETTDGRKLTIANSIAALNTIMGKKNRVVGAFIRFTGHDPLKPDNEPDEWESLALEKLRAGKKIVADYAEFEGKPYYRMMQPLALKPGCYKCHSYSQYKLGDIVGGLGVHVDMGVYSEARTSVIRIHLFSYTIIWLIGTLGIMFAGRSWKGFLHRNDILQQQLQDLAIHDPLTGFLNRHQVELIIDNELARAKRKNTFLSMILMDIDNFKSINDNYGHPAGDKILAYLASEFNASVRESDYLVRYGGDELMLIFTDSSHDETMKKAESIRSRIAGNTIDVGNDNQIKVTLSVGAATFPEHGKTFKELLAAADKALYDAKKSGRNRCCSAASSR